MGFKNCVYKFINNNDEINYIGKSINLKSRLENHIHLPKECYNSTYAIAYREFETKDDIDFIERYYIAKYKPKYNEIHKNKDLTIELDNVIKDKWKLYNNDNFGKRRFIKSIKEIEIDLNNIKIDIDIMEYYLIFTLEQNNSFNFYKRYKSYERLNNKDKLALYKNEFKELKNKDKFEKAVLLQNKVANEICRNIYIIFSKNRLLEYSAYLPQQYIKTEYGRPDKIMNLIQLNECINIADNTFKLYIEFKSKYYNISKQLNVWVKCRD